MFSKLCSCKPYPSSCSRRQIVGGFAKAGIWTTLFPVKWELLVLDPAAKRGWCSVSCRCEPGKKQDPGWNCYRCSLPCKPPLLLMAHPRAFSQGVLCESTQTWSRAAVKLWLSPSYLKMLAAKERLSLNCLLANFHPHVQDSTSDCSLEPPALGCALPAHKRGLSQWTKNDLEQHRTPCKLLHSPKRGARSQPLIAQAPHEKHLFLYSPALLHGASSCPVVPGSFPPPGLHSQRHSLPSAHGINHECCSYYLWVSLCSGEGCRRPGLEVDRNKGGEL